MATGWQLEISAVMEKRILPRGVKDGMSNLIMIPGVSLTFHADWELHASVPMIVVDLDHDGDGDLIHGKGHDYGLLWWENKGADSEGKLQWDEHMIDESYSQPHTLAWADVTGDGQPELITGSDTLVITDEIPVGWRCRVFTITSGISLS